MVYLTEKFSFHTFFYLTVLYQKEASRGKARLRRRFSNRHFQSLWENVTSCVEVDDWLSTVLSVMVHLCVYWV